MIFYACFFNLPTLLLPGFLKTSMKVQINYNFGSLSPEFSASCHPQSRVGVGGFLLPEIFSFQDFSQLPLSWYRSEFSTTHPRALALITIPIKGNETGTSLVARWLRIRLLNAGDMGLIPGPGRSHMPRSN